MKKLLLGLAAFTALQLNAQNYLISFTGSGASATVTSVKVDNLTTGTTLTLTGTDILRLTTATAENSPNASQPSGLRIYPNPMNEYSTIEILPPSGGEAVLTVSEIHGKTVATQKIILDNSKQGFKQSGLKSGFYLVDIKGKGFRFSGKLISKSKSNGSLRIEKYNSFSKSDISDINEEAPTKRSSLATIDMLYAAGNVLKFTGSYGSYKTIVADVPAANKTINFNFVSCVDADFNYYPVVIIDQQIWMAENLKTTKYNDNTSLNPVTVAADWTSTTAGSYCDYLNTPTYSTTYGRLYNWYAVASTNPKNVCPTGWHVPTDDQLMALQTYLGGEAAAGGKLKETGITHWTTPNTGATNSSGFTALPAGYRNTSGTYGMQTNYGYWWSATEATPTSGWYYYLYYGNGSFIHLDHEKHYGSSVRCLKN
jgi:uncharacterized protein (TIGR02145 family)